MKIIDIAIKDLKRSARSMFLVGMTLIAPLLITFLIYFAFGSMKSSDVSMTSIKVGVVNADELPAGAPLTTTLGASIRSMFFDTSVKNWIAASDYANEAAARMALDKQEIGVAVIIPAAFTAQYLAGENRIPVTILQDPTLKIGPTIVRDMIASLLDGVAGGGVAYQVMQARMAAAGRSIDPTSISSLFNQFSQWYADFQRAMFHAPEKAALVVTSLSAGSETSSTLQTMMGLVMAGQIIFFSFFTGANSMMTILQESEEGTLARLFITPTGRAAILMGKFLAVLLTVFLQGIILLVAGRLIFGIQWGEPGSVALALLGQIVAAVGLGVLLVAFIKTSRQAGPVFGGALSVLGMVSGLFTTNIVMPDSFNAIGSFTPQGWVLKAWKLSLAGQPPSELLVSCLVLLVMGCVMFAIGAALFRKRFA